MYRSIDRKAGIFICQNLLVTVRVSCEWWGVEEKLSREVNDCIAGSRMRKNNRHMQWGMQSGANEKGVSRKKQQPKKWTPKQAAEENVECVSECVS